MSKITSIKIVLCSPVRLDGSELYFIVNSTSAHFLNSGNTAPNAFAFSPWRGVAAIFMRDLYRLCLDVGGDDYGEREGGREIRANECTT